ncbi:MAG: hypothetical protein O7E54_01450, partial [Planctomycetota bacterium]|nr:hypothetical protein [Planctomycetota bacterium]
RAREARGIWSSLVLSAGPRSRMQIVAQARQSDQVTDALLSLEEELATDPTGGELLLRVRWTLARLKKP